MADNTKHNSYEQNKNTDTAEKQSNSKDDLALTQKIRQAVMKDGVLSMNAKNEDHRSRRHDKLEGPCR